MMKFVLALAAVLAAALLIASQTPIWDREGIPPEVRPGAGARASEAERQVLLADRAFVEAHAGRRAGALESVLAEEFTYIGDERLGRQEYLESVARAGFKLYEAGEVAVRVYDGAAVLTAREHFSATRDGRDISGRHSRLTVYVLRSGKWRAVVTQVRPLPGD